MQAKWTTAERRAQSERMKKVWANRKNNGSWPLPIPTETKPSLPSLYEAAAMLLDNDEQRLATLRTAICDCAMTTTIVSALEAETCEGTNLQARVRRVLKDAIEKAL
jgi:hypothetical protein